MWRQVVNIVAGLLIAVGGFFFSFLWLGILGFVILCLSAYELDLKMDFPRWATFILSIGVVATSWLFPVDSGWLFITLGVLIALFSFFATIED